MIWGALLFCLGCSLLYVSLSAIYSYFDVGFISWGRSPRRAVGEQALIYHGVYCLAGAAMAGKGIQQFFHGNDSQA